MNEQSHQTDFLSPLQIPSVPLALRRFEGGQFTNFIERRPLVFHHIPKTAGTSLTTHLKTLFDEQMIDAKSEKALKPLMAEVWNRKCVSGHFSPEFLFSQYGRDTVFTILRDPTARALSQHRDWSNKGRIESTSYAWAINDETLQALEIAEKSSPLDFLRSHNPIVARNTRNIFVRALIPRQVDPFTTDERLIDEAFTTLRAMFWFGMQHQMDLSLMMLWYQLGVPYHSEVLGLAHNRSDANSICLVSTTDLETINNINFLDRRLFQLAEAEFKRRTDCFYQNAVRTMISESYLKSPKYCHSTVTLYADDPNFLGGWSYREVDGNGRGFRWTVGAGPTQIMIPFSNRGYIVAVNVELHVLAAAEPGLAETLECILDTHRPSKKSIVSRGDEIEVVFDFDLDCAFELVGDEIITFWQRPTPALNSIGESRLISLAVHKMTCTTYFRLPR